MTEARISSFSMICECVSKSLDEWLVSRASGLRYHLTGSVVADWFCTCLGLTFGSLLGETVSGAIPDSACLEVCPVSRAVPIEIGCCGCLTSLRIRGVGLRSLGILRPTYASCHPCLDPLGRHWFILVRSTSSKKRRQRGWPRKGKVLEF